MVPNGAWASPFPRENSNGDNFPEDFGYFGRESCNGMAGAMGSVHCPQSFSRCTRRSDRSLPRGLISRTSHLHPTGTGHIAPSLFLYLAY